MIHPTSSGSRGWGWVLGCSPSWWLWWPSSSGRSCSSHRDLPILSFVVVISSHCLSFPVPFPKSWLSLWSHLLLVVVSGWGWWQVLVIVVFPVFLPSVVLHVLVVCRWCWSGVGCLRCISVFRHQTPAIHLASRGSQLWWQVLVVGCPLSSLSPCPPVVVVVTIVNSSK